GVMLNRVKYVDLPIQELYDLERDPGESRNLAASDPQQVERMRALLSVIRRGERESGRRAETADARERLESLGYVTGTADPAANRYTDADDPKHLLALDALLQEVACFYLAGESPAALALCR